MQQSKASYMYVCAAPPVENRDEKTGSISHASCPPTPPGAHQTNLLLIPKPITVLSISHRLLYVWFCSVLTVCILLHFSLSHSGKPETYAEYFSLNRTTAELLLLKPVDRELHRRFDLVIKVRNAELQTRGKKV